MALSGGSKGGSAQACGMSIPKILRRYFLYDRSLLSDLSRCEWESLKAFYTTGIRDQKVAPGVVVAIQHPYFILDNASYAR